MDDTSALLFPAWRAFVLVRAQSIDAAVLAIRCIISWQAFRGLNKLDRRVAACVGAPSS